MTDLFGIPESEVRAEATALAKDDNRRRKILSRLVVEELTRALRPLVAAECDRIAPEMAVAIGRKVADEQKWISAAARDKAPGLVAAIAKALERVEIDVRLKP